MVEERSLEYGWKGSRNSGRPRCRKHGMHAVEDNLDKSSFITFNTRSPSPHLGRSFLVTIHSWPPDSCVFSYARREDYNMGETNSPRVNLLEMIRRSVSEFNNYRDSHPSEAIRFWRADLSGAQLSKAHLCSAYLESASLDGADLSGADLGNANLEWTDLRGANLRGANLTETRLSYANVRGACLEDVIFSDARIHLLMDCNRKTFNDISSTCAAR